MRELCSPTTFMNELLEICQPLIYEKGILVEFDQQAIDSSIGKIFFDQEKMQLGLYHILLNAIKFNREFDGKIDITAELKNNELIYMIKDKGAGMTNQKIK